MGYYMLGMIKMGGVEGITVDQKKKKKRKKEIGPSGALTGLSSPPYPHHHNHQAQGVSNLFPK